MFNKKNDFVKINRKFINGFLFACVLFMAFLNIAAYYDIDHVRSVSPFADTVLRGYRVMRPAAVLTNSYVDTEVIRLDWYNSFALKFKVVQGSLTSIEYQVYWSEDAETWYQEVTESVSAGNISHTPATYNLVLTGDQNIFVPLPFYDSFIKIKVKGTGTVTGSSCAIGISGAR